MHYPKDAFSYNYLSTIEPLQEGVTIGNRDHMSPIDIEEVRLLYNCRASSTKSITTIITKTGLISSFSYL